MGFKENFEASEWQTLQFAPFWVYQLVAGADRDIDDKESERIVEEIAKAAQCEAPLAAEVLKSVSDDYFAVAERYAFDDRRSLDGLGDVAKFLKEKASPAAAGGFTEAVLGIGKSVAESSGGESGGPATGESEAAILDRIASALGGGE